jgi:hypothetical protein
MSAAQTGPLWRIASTRMPTKWGMFDAIGFERDVSDGTRRVETALALVMGDLTKCSARCAAIVTTSWKWPCRPLPTKAAGS